MARSYDEALSKLALLQSNRIITSLFETPSTTSTTTTQDLNAAAIPEMVEWLRRAGYSQADLARMKHIHVSGTKGKGSVCAYATAMLAKYRRNDDDGDVGTYTSPHLVHVRERIAINGEPVSREEFAAAFFEVWDRLTEAAIAAGMSAAEAQGAASKPFYFRFLTIMAWHIFLKRGIRDVVIECGIGGEYDSTNVLPKEAVSAAVIAQLGIDHVAMLGDTVEEIAWHKAGILKAGVKGFTMRLRDQPGVMDVLRKRAAEKDAVLVEVDEEEVERWGGVEGNLKGDFQKRNQALAVLAVREHLGLGGGGGGGDKLLEDVPRELVEGLREARLRGRCEVVDDGEAEWLLDGAHTKDSLEEVAKWAIQQHRASADEPLILVFNQQERNIAQLLEGFVGACRREAGREDVFRYALFTRNEVAKPAAGEERDVLVQEQAAEKMRELMPGCEVRVLDNTADAVAEARRLARGRDGEEKRRVLVTGSLHLVGSILQVLEP
ncbi:FolC bifunctional protein [Trichoderma reesei RUT C-30]|jgi:folylpolyglutamate synthase|uniref:Folylpolyglutamate synthase n=1 Tax=Hypocrea jecorina (strain ATCC 56765 / BCRC 32924 / NRRL 11460 / Rut C-30) TaxID=1344414 RepID=A0A024S9L0_HYPJR|nr:FolC bifunctional protein [Trichoderma reesei RUT C-30]